MKMEKQGIAVVGTLLVDKINEISAYPNSGELTKILRTSKAVGGCVPNDCVDLKCMDNTLTVKAVGCVGVDENGAFLTKILKDYGIDTTGIKTCQDNTSFTEVMSVKGGQRTFFTYAGADSKFGVEDIDFETLNVKMLHLGYLLLLEKVDNGDGVKILKKAKENGIRTSIDLVSENSDRYQLVLPCLAYTDNLIINEIEAGKLTGIETTIENLQVMAEKLISYGIKERVIIHTPSVSVCLSARGFTYVPSYDLPKDFIQGTVGAGDAFCSGALLQIYRGKSDEEILSFASAAAVASLSKADAVSGMRSVEEIEELCKNFRRKEICL